jgi:putative transcriptional regulator
LLIFPDKSYCISQNPNCLSSERYLSIYLRFAFRLIAIILTAGFVLNKTIENEKVVEMMKEEFQGKSVNISYGGPVAVDHIFFIYFATENLVKDSVEILLGLYMEGDYNQMRKLVLSGVLSADKVRLFGGYSGGETNQLEGEIKENYWLVKNITPEEVIAIDDNIWTNQINQLEAKYKMWTLIPEDPELN